MAINGSDDVTAEAGLIAMAMPGKPIRLQWMREQEFGWEPCGCAMVTQVEASLGADNRVAHWTYEVWSNTHNMRPVKAGGYVVAAADQARLPDPDPRADPDAGRRWRPQRQPALRFPQHGRALSFRAGDAGARSRRSARWAHISMCSAWSRWSTSWRWRRVPIRSPSASLIWKTSALAT
ncbi:MAG: hypothetical protein WDN24_20840 [Sphingomonas sp.]